MNTGTENLNYGNWVSTELIRKVVIVFLLFMTSNVILWIWLPGWLPIKMALALLTVLIFMCVLYFCAARYLFSSKGGNIQNKILELLMSQINWNGCGKALDIGCGSAALTIKLAKKYTNAQITGIDYWGGSWGYSKKRCEENSRMEGVSSRTEFIRASASKLPFDDNSFDLVVSNLTFHEVKDNDHKYDVIKEALRVVKKGGCFVFQDLFLLHTCYPDINELIVLLKKSGADDIHFTDTSKADFIPRVLKLPFMVGTIGMLYGTK